MHISKQAQMNSEVARSGKRAAEDDVGGPRLKRKRQGGTASRMRDHIGSREGSSMTGSQSTGALSQGDPLSDVIFEEEDLVLPFETPWNARDSKQPVRYLRNYRILSLNSQEDFCMSSIRPTSLEFEEQEELPHFLGLVRYKPGSPREHEERTAKNPELLMLSSKIWRAWWNRDPAAPDRSHWLQTQFATYILEEPHKDYEIYHDNQAIIMGITRRLIQAARIRPNCSLPNALSKFQRVGEEIRNEEIDEQELRAIVKRILSDLDPRGYENYPFGHGVTWDTRVHDMDVLWETLLFHRLIKWADYRSDFEDKPPRAKAEREPSQEI